jgi:peroxiredoxin
MKKLMLMSALAVSIGSNAQYQIGDKVADFNLKNVDGKMISMSGTEKAQGIIVIFTCNHCPFSIAYEDRIIELHKKYERKGYPVIAINPNDPVKSPEDSFDKMIMRAEEKKFPFPYVYDETQEVAKRFGASRTPHVFIVKKEGSDFVLKYIGAIDNNTENAKKADKKFVEEALDDLLSGKNPLVSETKAIGCTIKWK